MAVEQLRRKDIAGLLQAVPGLISLPSRRMWVDYDDKADVLYLSLDRPQKATDSEMRDDGIIIHRRGRAIVGLTILDASRREKT